MIASHLDQAAAVLVSGGIVAYPTESCFGLGCDPRNSEALRRLHRIKRRAAAHGFIIIAARSTQLYPYIDRRDIESLERAESTWPGPYTWLLSARSGLPIALRGRHDSIAVRVTAHPIAASLCRRAGRAIVSTSANRHGRAPARSADTAVRAFGGEIDCVVPGPVGGQARPTEIRDARSDLLIRPG